MSFLIARNVHNPLETFSYSSFKLNKRKGEITLFTKTPPNVKPGKVYELLLNDKGHALRILGEVVDSGSDFIKLKTLKISENKRRFPRFKVGLLNIPVSVMVDGEEFVGKCIDFSIGGTKIKFPKDIYNRLALVLEGKPKQTYELTFHLTVNPVNERVITVEGIPIRFNRNLGVVAFYFPTTEKNKNVFEIYDYILETLKFFQNI